MRSRLFAVSALLLSSCTASMNQPSSGGRYRATLKASEIMLANPVDDLDAALRREDTRFVGILDIAEDVPGAEQRPDAVSKFGVRYIEGTSDTAAWELESNAYDYAEIYNRLLIRRLKSMNAIPALGPPPTPLPPTTGP